MSQSSSKCDFSDYRIIGMTTSQCAECDEHFCDEHMKAHITELCLFQKLSKFLN